MMHAARRTFAVLVIVSSPIALRGLAAGDGAEVPHAPEGARTHTVRKEPLVVRLALDGMFEPAESAEVSLRPEVWTQLEVVEAVEPGTHVREGDRLVTLETSKIDEAIQDLETELAISELGLAAAGEDLRLAEESLELDLEDAERAKDTAEEDLVRFLTIEKPMSEKKAEVSLKSAANFLEYALEELRQLETMYKADDLTEETEEIILKRQRDTVERLRFEVESSRAARERALEVELPRRERDLKEAARRQKLNWSKARSSLPQAVKTKRLELEKKRVARKRSEEKLAKLRSDRAALEVRAPSGGIVYYGECVRGKWQNQEEVATKLRPGGALSSNQVFMTIVEPRALRIRAAVPEAELHWMRRGLEGEAVPTGFPDARAGVVVAEVATVPAGPGGFSTVLSLAGAEDVPSLAAGMTCKVELRPYVNEQAATVPEAALFRDGLDPAHPYVFVRTDAGFEKRRVKPGRRAGGKVEVLEGLEEGAEVLLERPAES